MHTPVFDIARDNPRARDRFLVDTNVWTMIADAGRPSVDPGLLIKANAYAEYIDKLFDCGAVLGTSLLTICELFKHIEVRACQRYYGAKNKGEAAKRLKVFRADPSRRAKVIELFRAEEELITAQSQIVDLPKLYYKEFMEGICNSVLDPIDSLIVVQAKKQAFKFILTDDSDFGSKQGIHIATGNRQLIKAAHKAGTLHARPMLSTPAQNS